MRDEKKMKELEERIFGMFERDVDVDVDGIMSIGEGVAWDDVKGGELKTSRVMEARREEMKFVRKHQVYEKCHYPYVGIGRGRAQCDEDGWTLIKAACWTGLQVQTGGNAVQDG